MTLSNKKHTECVVERNTIQKKVLLPHTVAKVGRTIKVRGQEGWKIVELLGDPEERPDPYKRGFSND